MITPLGFEQPIYVTRPLLPSLDSYCKLLQGIWERRWLTNKGQLHDDLEAALCQYLRVKHVSLTANGTLALALTFKAFNLGGEVVTTPLTSPATVNALIWAGLTPIFADVDAYSLTLNPCAAETAITPRTSAILGVHLYGIPCDVEAFQKIGIQHKLSILYDGAHAFGIEIAGRSLVDSGDATALSFHATKLFNTAEGGAVVTRDLEIKRRIDLLRTLGIADESNVLLPGINARMNEFEAALGLANLEVIDAERRARSTIADIYRAGLSDIEGISVLETPRSSQHYFVVRVGTNCALSRDELRERLKSFNIFARAYFFPLCSTFPFLGEHPSSRPENLPVAYKASAEVLCLPFYGELGAEVTERICDIIRYLVRTESQG